MSAVPSKSFHESLIRFRQPLRSLWVTLRSCSPLYLALAIMGSYAVWQAHTPVTMIVPFQLPKTELPFSGEMVADTLQDGLKSIRNEIEEERQNPGLESSDTGLPDLRNMLIPKFEHVQDPARFSVEVKGVSYERILSIARAVMHTETTVSGDVILKGKEFALIARAGDSGPWESVSAPITADGLRRATRDLAEKILATQDATLAGVALLKDGQVDRGLAMLNRARIQKPKDVGLKLNLCMAFAANRRYEEAIDCYQDVQTIDPSSPEVLQGLAQAYYLEGRRDDAIGLYYDLAYKRGQRAALLGLGEALDDTDHPEDALKEYDEFLAAEQQDRNRAIAHVKRSAALAHLGRHVEALAEYEKALVYSPRDALVLVHRGVELARAGELDAGIAQLQSVVEENTNANSIPFAHLQLGILLQQKGDWREARAHFHKATELRPNYVEAHLKLAGVLVHEGFRSEALAEYNRVARLSALDVERGSSQVLACQWLGDALRDQGDVSGAASAYRAAIRLSPEYGTAHGALAFILERQGHLSQAIREYRAALAAPKLANDEREWLVMTHDRLAAALLKQGRSHWAESIGEFRKALELDPNHLESHMYLGEVFYDEGNFVKAGAEYKQAIKIDPQSAAAHNQLSLTLDKQGLREQASLNSRTR